MKVKLKIAVSETRHTAALRDGRIAIEGVDAEFVTVKPQIGAFRRMVRDVEFDVCELAPTTYIIARAYGRPFKALPVFVSRAFHHHGLLVRPDAGIRTPRDLEGKRVGVRAWSVTTGVWTRGILMEEFGLDCSRVIWVVDDEEHVTELPLPDNVVRAPAGRSLAAMMAAGELAAGFAGNAGIGRTGDPNGGWQEVAADYPDLFPDAKALEAEWFHRTGIYPMHGTIVVKDSVLAAHPGIARALYEAFEEAKRIWLGELAAHGPADKKDRKHAGLREIVGADPLPYGIEPNLPTIAALERTAFAQGLTPRRMAIDELFVDVGA